MSFISFPLVSVIVFCRNHINHIESCIKSILGQTYNNIELIAIDDGSQDGSDILLESLSKKYGFYFEKQDTHGLRYTLNKGLTLAKGDYVCSFSADDVMVLDRIEKQVDILATNMQAGACSGNMLAIDAEGEVLTEQDLSEKNELTFEDIFCDLIKGAPTSTFMMRKSMLDVIGWYDPAIEIDDLYIWLKITHSGCSIINSSDIYTYYRQPQANASTDLRTIFYNRLKIIDQYKIYAAEYENISNQLIVATFIRASQMNKAFARELLCKFPICRHPMKYIKGMGSLLIA